MKKNILIVEDEPNIVTSLTFILEHEGYRVDVIDDGNLAIQGANQNRPSVIILDLMLPNRNGFQILKDLKQDSNLKQIPVLMLTAKGQQHDRSTAEQLGVDAFITKPFANQDVVDCVNKLYERVL